MVLNDFTFVSCVLLMFFNKIMKLNFVLNLNLIEINLTKKCKENVLQFMILYIICTPFRTQIDGEKCGLYTGRYGIHDLINLFAKIFKYKLLYKCTNIFHWQYIKSYYFATFYLLIFFGISNFIHLT